MRNTRDLGRRAEKLIDRAKDTVRDWVGAERDDDGYGTGYQPRHGGWDVDWNAGARSDTGGAAPDRGGDPRAPRTDAGPR